MRYGIVGGGPAALARLDRIIQNVEEGNLSSRAEITIFEKNGEFGRGMPYSKANNHPDLRLNIAAEEPSIADEGEAFHTWLSTKSDADLKVMGIERDKHGEVSAGGCYSRSMAMGAFLEEYGEMLLARAQAAGLKVNVRLNSEVVDYDVLKDGTKRLVVKGPGGLEAFDFDGIGFNMGHWVEKDPAKPAQAGEPIVFNSPWPATKLADQIPAGSITGVIGSGPTGADSVIMLGHLNGKFTYDANGKCHYQPNPGAEGFKAIMASKSGLIPQYRGDIDMEEYISEEDFLKRRDPKTGFLPLDSMFDIFRTDMKNRYPEFAAKIEGLDRMGFLAFAQWLKQDFAKQGGGLDAFQKSIENVAQSQTKAEAAGGDTIFPQAMQDVFINLYVFSEAHKHLSAEDKFVFSKSIKPIISKVAAPLPPEIADKLDAMARAGAFELRQVDEKNPTEALKGEVHSIIMATGQSNDMTKHPAALVQSMIQKGHLNEHRVPFAGGYAEVEAFAEKNGVGRKVEYQGDQAYLKMGGVAVDENYTMLDKNGKPTPGVSYVGPNCMGDFDALSLIYSRDASISITADIQNLWNLKAGNALNAGVDYHQPRNAPQQGGMQQAIRANS